MRLVYIKTISSGEKTISEEASVETVAEDSPIAISDFCQTFAEVASAIRNRKEPEAQ